MAWPHSHRHQNEPGSLPGQPETLGIEPRLDSLMASGPDSVHTSGHPGEVRCRPPFAGEPRGAVAAPIMVERSWPWCNGSPAAPLPDDQSIQSGDSLSTGTSLHGGSTTEDDTCTISGFTMDEDQPSPRQARSDASLFDDSCDTSPHKCMPIDLNSSNQSLKSPPTGQMETADPLTTPRLPKMPAANAAATPRTSRLTRDARAVLALLAMLKKVEKQMANFGFSFPMFLIRATPTAKPQSFSNSDPNTSSAL